MNIRFATLLLMVSGILAESIAAIGQGAEPTPVRIAAGVNGHIHPAFCVTQQGTLVVIFGQSDFKDLRVTRSTDAGKSWSEPKPFGPAVGEWLYPGSLTTLADGRIVHLWNRWSGDGRTEPRHVVYSISKDDGVTWSEAIAMPKGTTYTRVVRHPLLELGPDAWLVSCSDATFVFHPSTGQAEMHNDGRTDPQGPVRPIAPIVRTPQGDWISGYGLRSQDAGKTWSPLPTMPDLKSQGWRHDLAVLPNGWLLASEVVGPGVGGDLFRYVVSHDDGQTWKHQVEFLKPGRPIGGRACPRALLVDPQTVGIVYYDVDAKQPGGPGVFFLRLPLAKFAPLP